MVPRAVDVAGEAQCPSEAEMGVVVDGVRVDDGLELGRCLLELAVAEVRAAQGLADGALLGRLAGRLGKRDGRLAEAAVLEQLHTPAVEGIEVLAGLLRHAGKCRTHDKQAKEGGARSSECFGVWCVSG